MKKGRPFGSIPAASLILFGVYASSVLAQSPDWKGSWSKADGVIIVKNPKTPIYPAGSISMREELSIGGSDGPPEALFSLISSLAVGADGRIYAVDTREMKISVFDRNGKFVRSFGRKGQGPGEFFFLVSASYIRSRNELFVFDRLSGSYFNQDGIFVRNWRCHGNIVSLRADRQGRIRGLVEVRTPDRLDYQLRLFENEGQWGKILASRSQSLSEPDDPYQPILAYCLSEDGQIIQGIPSTYEFAILDPEGHLIRKVSRDYDPVEVTQAEREIWTKSPSPTTRKRTFRFSPFKRAYDSIDCDDKGWIYVGRREKGSEIGRGYYDVFDREGRYLTKFDIQGAICCIIDDQIYSVTSDEDDNPIIKRFKMTQSKAMHAGANVKSSLGKGENL